MQWCSCVGTWTFSSTSFPCESALRHPRQFQDQWVVRTLRCTPCCVAAWVIEQAVGCFSVWALGPPSDRMRVSQACGTGGWWHGTYRTVGVPGDVITRHPPQPAMSSAWSPTFAQ